MKIKKFNESKSNRLEWLDGETFELQKFTGSIVDAKQIPLVGRIPVVITEFENCIGISAFFWDSHIDSSVKLFQIGPAHGGEKLQSPDYSFFVFWRGPSFGPQTRDSIAVFDKNAKLILVINDVAKMYLKGDTLYLDLLSAVIHYDLKTNHYEIFPTVNITPLVKNTVQNSQI